MVVQVRKEGLSDFQKEQQIKVAQRQAQQQAQTRARQQSRTQPTQVETITSGGTQLLNGGGDQQSGIQYQDTQAYQTQARIQAAKSATRYNQEQQQAKQETQPKPTTSSYQVTTSSGEVVERSLIKQDGSYSVSEKQLTPGVSREPIKTYKQTVETPQGTVERTVAIQGGTRTIREELTPIQTIGVIDVERQQSRLANPLEREMLKQRQASGASALETKSISVEEASKIKGVKQVYFTPGEKAGQEKVLSLNIKQQETLKGTSKLEIDKGKDVISQDEISKQLTKERIATRAQQILFPSSMVEKSLPTSVRLPYQIAELSLSELEQTKTFGDFFKFQAGKPITEAKSETKYVIGLVGTLASFSDIEEFVALRQKVKSSEVKLIEGEGVSTNTLKGEKINTILERGTIKDLPYERRIIQQEGLTTELIKYDQKVFKIETVKGEQTSNLRILDLSKEVPTVIEAKKIPIPETQSQLRLSIDPLKTVSGSTTETLIVSHKVTSSDILYTEIQSQKQIGKLTKQDVINVREQPSLLKGLEGKSEFVQLKQSEDIVALGINQPTIKPQQFDIEISSKQRAEVLGSITDIRTTRLQQVEKAQFGVTELNKPEIVLGEGINLKEVSVEIKPIEKKIVSEQFTLELKGTEAKVFKPSEEFLIGQKSSVSEFKFGTKEEVVPYSKWKGLTEQEKIILGTQREINKLDILNTPKVKEVVKEEEQFKRVKPIFDTNFKSNIKGNNQIALTDEILSETRTKETYYLNPKQYLEGVNLGKTDVSYFGVRTDIFTKETSLPKITIISPQGRKERETIIPSSEVKREFIFLPVSESKIKPVTLTESLSKPKQDTRFNLDVSQRPTQRLSIDNIQKQDVAIKQEQKQEQLLETKQENIFKQKQESQQVFRQPQFPRMEGFKPMTPSLPIPPIKVPSLPKESKGLFSVEVGKAESKYKFEAKNLSLDEAKSFARSKVRGTAAASFVIKPQSEKARMELTKAESDLEKEFSRSKRQPERFVQKASQRISSAGEKAQITQKGILASKQKRSKQKGFKL